MISQHYVNITNKKGKNLRLYLFKFHFYQNLTYFGLDRPWHILSYSTDAKGLQYVSSMEHRRQAIQIIIKINQFYFRCFLFCLFFSSRYPFYGVQFHPEKNIYEWLVIDETPHGKDATEITQYFENFFVNQCRMNQNRFSGVDEENHVLIFNFPVTFTAALHSYEQIYFFEANVDYPRYYHGCECEFCSIDSMP